MARRLFDLLCAGVGLVLAAPILLSAALGIRLSSPGPVLYRARRIGRWGRSFTMYKLRTMHVEHPGSRITGAGDPRVFPLGRLLRAAKIDELPQLLNVLRGDMAVVGPRPEEPDIVSRHYTGEHRETLEVRPGLASPGSLYSTTHGDRLLAGADPEEAYVERLMPVKLALDRWYVRHASLPYDLALIWRTIATVAAVLAGRREFPEPPELAAARGLVVPARRPRRRAAAFVMLLLMAVAAAACREAGGPDQPPFSWTADLDGPILVGAGDIAGCGYEDDEATAALLDRIPGVIFTTGDNVYPDGSGADFARCYAPSWGRHVSRTRPSPGQHDYHTPEAAGYFEYFGANAGARGLGYYAYSLGSWRVISLNSETDMRPGSPQMQWLLTELVDNSSRCTAVYWHRPRFSSGTTHGGSTRSEDVWRVLYEAGVELVLNGDEHHYERFAPQTPAGVADPDYGVRQFVVGTGGRSNYPFGSPLATSQVRLTGAPGVLALVLGPAGYRWRFQAVGREAAADSGSAICHDPPEAAPNASARLWLYVAQETAHEYARGSAP
jgi:lipopolysaccharide/colanic/teichoic acid biosynthesis glycosyltransferase